MSLSKISLKSCLRLTAASLALTLVGCGLNPFADDTQEAPAAAAPAPTAPSYDRAPSSQDQPAAYEPVLERVNEPVPLADGAPDEYVVQVGDTLWDIAATFLKDPWFWPEIWYVNPDIENPHLIYPGDVLGLVYIDGQPRITNVRASTYRLSPQALVTPLTEAITSIPYEDVAAFLSSGVILEKDQLVRPSAPPPLALVSLLHQDLHRTAQEFRVYVTDNALLQVVHRLPAALFLPGRYFVG